MHHDALGKRTIGDATCYLRFSQAVPVHLRQTIREVYDVKVPKGMRGKGSGTRLIKAICAEADHADKVLILLPLEDKIKWYTSLGFEQIQDSPPIMMRKNKNG